MGDGFKIQITNPNEIYNQLKSKEHIDFGELGLEDPIEKVRVCMWSQGNYFKSTCDIVSVGPYEEKVPLNLPVNELKKKFDVRLFGRTVYILDSKGEREYEVTNRELELGGIAVFMGCSEEGWGGTRPKKIEDLEKFVSNLKRYKEIVETTINGIYKDEKIKNQEISMDWRSMEDYLETAHTNNLQKRIEVIEKPDVYFDDIGGQEEAKKEMQTILFARKHPEVYKKWGTRPPKGVLLVGPPGNGKTLIAKAFARECDSKMYHIKVSDILRKWFGDSERLMQEIFDISKKEGGILFFDELEALGSDREKSHEASAKTLTTLLENLDGLRSSDNITVVSASNKKSMIDSALLRPGRIDRIIEVPLPNEIGREQIFKIYTSKAVKLAERELFKELDYSALVKNTKDYSGADISEIIRRVLEERVLQEGLGKVNIQLITTPEILNYIKNYERKKEADKKIGFIRE